MGPSKPAELGQFGPVSSRVKKGASAFNEFFRRKLAKHFSKCFSLVFNYSIPSLDWLNKKSRMRLKALKQAWKQIGTKMLPDFS